MIGLIFKKEIGEALRTPRFLTGFLVATTLIIIVFITGGSLYKSQEAQYYSNVQQNLSELAGKTDWFNFDHDVFWKPKPLAVLFSGISSDIGRNVPITSRGELVPRSSFYAENTLFAVFRFLDLEFVFKIILPLFAMLLGYDAINGEKEKGTLRLCFTNSLRRHEFILGKLFANLAVLIVPLLIPILLGLLIWQVMGIPLSGSDVSRFTMIILASFMYLSLFLVLSILFSTLTEKSSTSFLLLLSTWIAAIAFIPGTAVTLSSRLTDVPSYDHIQMEKSNVRNEMSKAWLAKMQEFKLPEGYEDPQEAMGALNKYMQEISNERQQNTDEMFQRINEDYQNKLRKQERVSLAISKISPTAVYGIICSELASSGLSAKDEFAQSLKEYQSIFKTFMDEKTDGMGSGGFRMIIDTDDDSEEAPKVIDPQELPMFEASFASIGTSINRVLPDFALLGIVTLFLFAVSVVRFQKFDLR